MADIPDMPALVEVLKREFGVRDHFARAILTAVLPLVVGPVEEALEWAVNKAPGPCYDDDCRDGECVAARSARNILSQLKALGGRGMVDEIKAIDAIARAICQEDCAFRGEPACWEIDPDHWPPPACDEPGCMAYARAAFFALPRLP